MRMQLQRFGLALKKCRLRLEGASGVKVFFGRCVSETLLQTNYA